jgi:hypothetical protein
MFLEAVPIPTTGTTLADVMADYGIPERNFPQIVGMEENKGLKNFVKGALGLRTPLPGTAGAIFVPIDVKFENKVYKAELGTTDHLLRPPVEGCPQPTHGATAVFKKACEPCLRIRWVQTVITTNPSTHELPECIDGGHMPVKDNPPFYYPWFKDSEIDPVDFSDTAAAAYAPGRGKTLTLSCVVWTTVGAKERITLIQTCVWGFKISPGGERVPPHLNPAKLHTAPSKSEIDDHLRILEKGIAGGGGCETDEEEEQPPAGSKIQKLPSHQTMPKNLVYRRTPVGHRAVNVGI